MHNRDKYVCIYIYIYIYMHIISVQLRACKVLQICISTLSLRSAPSPPTKSSGFRGFDSSKLLILRGGNYHIHMIV